MNILIQLICMIISYAYGWFIRLFIIFNNRIFKTSKLLLIIINKVIYTFIIVISYVILIYKINMGIFHIYFLLLMLLGYVNSNKIICKIKM